MNTADAIPPRLAEIIEDFTWAEGREKVEMLVEYSEQMPPLPERLQSDPDCMAKIEECMTPVYVAAELEDGQMHFYFNVPPESPTVRGFASILGQGLDGATPEQVLATPNDFFTHMGLDKVLTPQRMNGLSAILAHMKRLASEALLG
jgi:cysteine desulfuration protein SufE